MTPPHHHVPYSTLHKLIPSEKSTNPTNTINMNSNANMNANILPKNMNSTQGNLSQTSPNIGLQRQYSNNS